MSEPYVQAICEKVLTEHELVPVCPAPHCEEFQRSKVYHAACAEKAVYNPVTSMGCYNSGTNEWKWGSPEEIGEICLGLIEKDRRWKLKNCFCCCACMARKTPIALPHGIAREIGDIQAGDVVLAGSVAGGQVAWEEAEIHFSQGTLGGEQPAMVYVVYGDGLHLILTTDQVLMLADGSLTTAGRLLPGQRLRGQGGEEFDVTLVSLGGYTGGVHHIATSLAWSGSLDGHLIAANGVVAGDYTLQVNFGSVSQELKAADWESLPEVGTPQYTEFHSHLLQLGEVHTYAATPQEVELDSGVFSAYQIEQSGLPAAAQSFVTAAQAQDIVTNGKQQPVTNRSGYGLAQTAIAVLSGFYRNIVFYIDWPRDEPNVYAFEQYGEQVVVLCGGLARMEGLSFEGLTMSLAQSVARFLGGEPRTGSGYACTGEADLYAFGAISRQIWFGEAWLSQSLSGIEQLKRLFAFIEPEHAKGNPLDVCDEPAIECRIKTWMTGLAGGGLPECAGGPPRPPLTLEQASANGSDVTLVFSAPPEPEAAVEVVHYTLTPPAQITAAAVDPEEDFRVHLTVSGLKQGDCTVSVSNLKSTLGGKLSPDPASARFTVSA